MAPPARAFIIIHGGGGPHDHYRYTRFYYYHYEYYYYYHTEYTHTHIPSFSLSFYRLWCTCVHACTYTLSDDAHGVCMRVYPHPLIGSRFITRAHRVSSSPLRSPPRVSLAHDTFVCARLLCLAYVARDTHTYTYTYKYSYNNIIIIIHNDDAYGFILLFFLGIIGRSRILFNFMSIGSIYHRCYHHHHSASSDKTAAAPLSVVVVYSLSARR